MIRRRGLWAWLLSCLTFYVVGDEGGGTGGDAGADGDDDFGNTPITQGAANATGKDGPGASGDNGAADGGDNTPLTREETDRLKALAERANQQELIDSAVSEIKKTIPDFDIGKVRARLIEMHKKDPAQAARYNNPVGWELLHTQMARENADDYDFSPSRNEGGDIGKEKLLEAAARGDMSARAKLIQQRL